MSSQKAGARLRAVAAQAVHAVTAEGRSLDAALADAEARLPSGERPFLRHLCYETLRSHWRLRAQLGHFLKRPLARHDRIIEALLAVGLTQLEHTRVAKHAAVTLTVEATRALRQPKFAALVNAVLRRYLREGAPLPATDEARWNHPQWLLERLREDWPGDWQAIATANNARAPQWLRVNAARNDRAAWVERLRRDAPPVEAVMPDGLDAAVVLAAPLPVAELPGFDDGLVSVQDGAAQLAAPWLLRDGGRRILDACAAPGNKTGHLRELAAPEAELTAVDIDAARLERVRENLARLGFVATVLAGDASKPHEWWDGTPYERILVDAPCSASGVIRRHPDIRLLRRAEDIERLAEGQMALLRALWPLLAPGGRLLYVTCSVFAAENDGLVARFLDAAGDAREDPVLPNNNIRALMCRRQAGWQILPGSGRMDGFFYACLEKRRGSA